MGYRSKPFIQKVCEHCNTVFSTKYARSKYCSASCNTLACYGRNEYEYQSGHYIKSKKVKNALEVSKKGLQPSSLVMGESSKKTMEFNAQNIGVTTTGVLLADLAKELMKKSGIIQSHETQQILLKLRDIEAQLQTVDAKMNFSMSQQAELIKAYNQLLQLIQNQRNNPFLGLGV